MPVEETTLEARFWAKVWRCTHRHPCKRCCWPWRDLDLSEGIQLNKLSTHRTKETRWPGACGGH
jgi:hypothetical protein